jgi:hypothetical protein
MVETLGGASNKEFLGITDGSVDSDMFVVNKDNRRKGDGENLHTVVPDIY